MSANGDGIAAEVAFTESLGPETLVHFRSDALEVIDRREQVEAGEEEQSAGSLGELLVARFGPTTTVAADQRVSLKISAERMLLFDAATGTRSTKPRAHPGAERAADSGRRSGLAA